ncbi:hypothetical protein UA08_00261 [Talaromyces atroroseus]|uniref:Ras modification protein ERF4 n=1 Tax=Talaromyces atroroseus TaxID=1441469 RepID=A0A225AVJ0_TALAT|nr:hypothetical protein UA08_00261 [Talaromyces atroroseus]OKL63633.1 hypothetical protein UA08_00261 [Talaromyces atroroseus]
MGAKARPPQNPQSSPFHLAESFSALLSESLRSFAPPPPPTTPDRFNFDFRPSTALVGSFYSNLSPLAAKNDYQNFTVPGSQDIPLDNYHTTQPATLRPANTHARRHQGFPLSNRHNSNSGKAVNRSPSSFRLWNPINHVPRTAVVSIRGDEDIGLIASDRDAYPLLSLPEHHRNGLSSTTSLAVEYSAGGAESGRTSIALPSSRRRSQPIESAEHSDMPAENNNITGHIRPDDGIIHPPRHAQSNNSLRASTYASYPSNGGNNINSGEADGGEELAWGPAHPCYPHMNPHVPLQSEEFTSTRIIRIRRDWMVKGDLAPTFSNLYPEILDPLLPEQEFRRIIAKVNGELVKAFDPFSLRNWFDAAMGLVTGWLWDEMGFAGIKSHLHRVEDWLEKWNREVGSKDGVRIWSLRRTAYMTLDIQIPDPKVGLVNPEDASVPGTRPDTGFDSETPTAPAEAHVR